MAANNNNKNLNVPSLRFPGFSDEWRSAILEDIAHLSKGSGISKDKLSVEGKPCILYGELYTKYTSEIINEVFSRTNTTENNLVQSDANDVIIPASGETAIDISTARCILKSGVLLGGDLNIIRFENQDGSFFSYQLNGVRKLDIARIAQGVSVVHLYGDKLRKLRVFFPSLTEQKRISQLLSLLDERIATQRKIIEKLESLMAGIRQQLTETGIATGRWRMTRLNDVLIERKEPNFEGYEVYSVSVSKGLINQVEYLGRSFAAKDTSNYNIVKFGDVVYTKSPTGEFPFGIVKQSDIHHPVAVSPLYGVYEPLSVEIGTILHQYFLSSVNTKNYLSSLIQKGAKNTINISNSRFLENSVPLPISMQEVKEVAALFRKLSSKVECENRILNHLQNQRKFFLSQMFI